MSSRTKVVIVILLAGVLLAGCFGILLAYSLYKAGPALASASVLEYRISGEIGDTPAPEQTISFFETPNSLLSIVGGIQRAKQDGRIKALLLIVQDPQMGYAKTEELRDALKDFRSSGKPVYVYMERGSDIDYYLATAADKIYLSPTGDLDVKGLAASATFLKGFFEKLKIEPNFERHGKYKSFADTYTRSDMSEEHREQVSVLLDDLYSRYVASIAEARKLDVERVKQLIDAGPYSSALKAVDTGLIDGGLYLDEVRERVRSDLKLEEYKPVHGKKYAASRPGFNLSAQKIAVVYATGAIAPGRSGSSPFTGSVLGSETIAAAIKAAREDEDVKAVILRVDSPGGSALASDLIWREVVLTKQKKPVVASMSDVAASGGYYIAMAANKIVAQPGTITGSIGVVSGKLDISGLYREHLGINVEIIKRGENADYYSEQRSFTEEQRAKFHQDVMDFYYTFVKKAAEGRQKSPEEIDRVAQGRVWTGVRAKEIGLVDELGGMDKAVELARQLSNLGADTQVQLEEYPKIPTLFEAIFPEEDENLVLSRDEEAIARLLEALPSEAREALRLAHLMQRFERDRIFAVMPYTLKVR